MIAGGGTAGWMAAAAISRLLGKNLHISLIESDEISTVGVGEATIPTLLTFHKLLKIDEQEFMTAVQGTFKLGIGFKDWLAIGEDYIHSFGATGRDCWAAGFQHFWLKGLTKGVSADLGDYCVEHVAARDNRFGVLPNQRLNYAYHIDAGLYAKFLRKISEQHGVHRIEGKITDVQVNHDSGFIESVRLESGAQVAGDLFIDCTGFRGLLIEQTLHTGYDDWSHWLPSDSAVAVQTQSVDSPLPYTRTIAHESGWQWRIPLQSRVGNGLVYCSRYCSDSDAEKTLMDNILGDTITDPKLIRFRTGQRRKHWNKNCVALGLAAGFIEPLESTSIHLIQRGIIRLMQLFPVREIQQVDVDEFNKQTESETANIRDFIIAHYHLTERTDSRFWRHCQTMPIPDSLAHRIELFRETGRVFMGQNELFSEGSWMQVMLGQGVVPKEYHPIVDLMSDAELDAFLRNIKASVQQKVETLPAHMEFVNAYCRAD